MEETWMEMEETPDYLISNWGNIRRKNNSRTFNGVKNWHNNDYYPCFKPTINGVSGKLYSIHSLVAKYFVPNTNPEIYKEIDHIDGNKKNNHFSNLRWTDKLGNLKNRRFKPRKNGIPRNIRKIGNLYYCYIANKLYGKGFKNIENAIDEYNHFVKQVNGEYAVEINKEQAIQHFKTINPEPNITGIVSFD